MTTEHTKKRDPKILVIAAFIVIVIGGGIAAFAYVAASQKTVYIDNAKISAPLVDLSATNGGTLKAVFVAEGDIVPPNTVVAQVDTELIKSSEGGLVVTVNNNIGKSVAAGNPVVIMIDPKALRVVGQVQENKGLIDIQTGDRVAFSVDAYGSKQFTGRVDSIAPTSESGDVVFSVSDKREEQNFDVKVAYDPAAHPELKNGMSAKMWVYKNTNAQ